MLLVVEHRIITPFNENCLFKQLKQPKKIQK